MKYILGVLVMALLLPVAALGQSVGATTGAINGRVVDSSDSVLPGVTVTISSPQMQGAQAAITNAEGNYRFPGIPPGTYMVRYELPGFANVLREGIRVTLGFTATLNVTMAVSGLQETVTVSGASPVVDVSSTQDVDQLRLQRTGLDSKCSRHVGHPVGVAWRDDGAHRCWRECRRHAERLSHL